ncbi:MAG: HPF/RaiA family ribosome-associated protein [Nitrospirae bacterium]|nr:HPF/RaiA family ribosome-associated protein [Nitrospirota bacterium]
MAIHYRNVEVDPMVEGIVEEHLDRLGKYLLKARGGVATQHAEISFRRERGLIRALIAIKTKGGPVAASGRGRSPGESASDAFEKIRVQLHKRKDRLQRRARVRGSDAA